MTGHKSHPPSSHSLRLPLRSLLLQTLLVLGLLFGASSCKTSPEKKVQADKSDTHATHSENRDSTATVVVDDPAVPTLSGDEARLDSLFPLPEHLQRQKELLLKHSETATEKLDPDGEYLEGKFNSGAIDLVLDEIDGEPSYFYGRLPESDTPGEMEFIAYGISLDELDALVPGEKYQIQWMETVVDMKPFDDDRYRYFIAYHISRSR